MAGPWEDYAPPAASSAKPWEDYAPAPVAATKPTVNLTGEGWDKVKNYSGRNAIGGVIRGAGSIGATLMRPFDTATENQQRRIDMDSGLTSLIGSNPESMAYKTNKLGMEVAGTSGIGGAAAKALNWIPGLSRMAPGLIEAIKTGGMSANGATGMGGLATRAAGGAINGALSAGAVDPEDATTGAVIGGSLPVAVKLAGQAGSLIGKAFTPDAINPQKLETARESMAAGYIIPPSMVQPSFKNRTMETLSGKFETAQMAATKNQAVTEGLVRKGLGLPADAALSFDTMRLYRGAQHSAGYEPLRNVGDIPAGPQFNQSLDDIAKQYTGKGTIPAVQKTEVSDLVNAHKSSGFDTGDAVDAIRILRENASEAFTKGDGALGKANKAIADAYEGAIDNALTATGQKDLLDAYRTARQNIAKSATVEKAIREGSGTLDARVLARELQKGKPLSGEIKTAAQFANVFDKSAQPPHLIGSPGVNNLKAGLATLTAGIGGAAMGPGGIALGAANYLLPPLARSRMFSQGAQQGLLSQGYSGTGQGLLGSAIDDVLPMMYRTSPLLAGSVNGQ